MARFRDDGWPRDWYCKYEDCSSQIINIFVHLTSDKKNVFVLTDASLPHCI